MQITWEIERLARATIGAWTATIRRCLIAIVVAAATTVTMLLITAALFLFTK